MSRFINPVPQFFLNDGSLASSGRIKFFANKDYSTLKDTFSQPDNTIPNTNPLALDGAARLPACFGEGLYSIKFYAYDPNEPDGLGTLQWTRDDVSLSQLTGQFDSWSAIETYSLGDKVKASSGDYYESIQNGNKGNNPLTSPSYWSKVIFITSYNVNVNYAVDKIVEYQGKLYRSNVSPNLNNTPPSSQWDNLTFNNNIVGNLTVTGNVVALNTPKTAKKVIDTARASTATLAADPELSISVLATSSFYKVSALIIWDGNGGTGNGLRIRIGGTDITLMNAFYINNTNTTSSNVSPSANVADIVSTGFAKAPNYAGATESLIIEAVISTSGSGSPTVWIEWCQQSSNATSTRLKAFSSIIATKI